MINFCSLINDETAAGPDAKFENTCYILKNKRLVEYSEWFLIQSV
jgi:hypothetical protein